MLYLVRLIKLMAIIAAANCIRTDRINAIFIGIVTGIENQIKSTDEV